MVIENPIAAVNAAGGANGNNNAAHPSGIPQDKIDNIMSGIANTGDVKMNNHRKKLRQRFDIIKKLGQGTYGKVQLGINKETGQEVAIKTIKKCKIEAEADLVRIRREVQIMSSVQHPNIIHIYEVFENREKMVLVMEFAAGGELYDYLSERKVLSEEEARRIFRQVATAVYYCHKHKICHRDLKLENILLDEHGNAKIADFGLSNVFDDQHLLGTFCGSPLYASPEIVEGTPYWGPEVDCWSLGVLLYTLVYGSMPFDGSNFKRLVKQISQGDYYEPKKPSRASSLIREMLTVCPQKRASIEQICSHWWVNENDNVSCLELAENLANQTPVRLDVLLSLTPAAVVAEQLVVPSADGSVAGKGTNAAMPRSHSVGSIRDLSAANATTEAEQRILDMVAAGGEAALMPSPTRTITPAQSPVQTKRKLETTISTDNAALALKKKEKAGNNSSFVINESTMPLNENEPMDTDDAIVEEPVTPAAAVQHTSSGNFSEKDMELINDMCAKLINQDTDKPEAKPTTTDVTSTSNRAGVGAGTGTGTGTGTGPVANTTRQKTVGKLDAVEETPEEKEAAKVINKFVNKQKTADLVNAVEQTIPTTTTNEKVTETTKKTPMTTTTPATTTTTAAAKTTAQKPSKISPSLQVPPPIPFVRKCSLQDESTLNKFNGERRKSRILETAEKFQQMNAQAAPQQGSSPLNEKPKKIVIPGVSVGSFKKEFERKGSKAAGQQQGPTLGEKRAQEQAAAAAADAAEREISPEAPAGGAQQNAPPTTNAVQPSTSADIESSDSKNSVHSLSLDDARRSMENSIALLRQAQNETATKDVDQLCAKTESIGVSEPPTTKLNIAAADRERKLQSARAIIGSAITPVIRRPQAQPLLPIPQQPPPPPFQPSRTTATSLAYGIAGGGGESGNGKRNFGGYNQVRAIINPNVAQIGGMNGNGNGSGNGSGSGGFGSVGLKYAAVDNIGGNHNRKYAEIGNSEGGGPTISNGSVSGSLSLPTTPNIDAKSNPIFNANLHSKAALARARQNIMRHFATGGAGWNILSSFPPKQQQQQQNPQSMIYCAPMHGANVSTKAKIFGQQEQQQRRLRNASAPFLAGAAAAAAGTASSTAADAAAIANNVVNMNSVPKPFYNARTATPPTSSNWLLKSSPPADPNNGTVKTSTASITLKSATLPRRKTTAKTEIQLDIKPPRIVEQEPAMRFTTEMQHPIADVRSAPARDGPMPFSPVKQTLSTRAASLEPKEHIIHVQRPPQVAYSRTTSNSTNRSGSLSRQSTNDSESDTTTNLSQSTMTASSQPIKKSPREFIIPIAVEGGGFITPREGSIEPSESSHTTSSRSTFNRFNQRPARRIGSLLSDSGVDETVGQFQKMRTASTTHDGDEDGHFTLHKLRSTRPVKKASQDNDSNSSGEEDDDDGFEILTAENLFSTLLQRVRALTNRLNVNNDLTSGFPNSCRLLTSMRHDRGPFWNQEPFTRSQMSYTYSETVEKQHVRLNKTPSSANKTSTTSIGAGAPWRHSLSRDLSSDMESMFSRTGATLPRVDMNLSYTIPPAHASSFTSHNNSSFNSNHSFFPIRSSALSAPRLITTSSSTVRSNRKTTTPPRGSSSKSGIRASQRSNHEQQTPLTIGANKSNQTSLDEPLDLADLDLSRLRLSKKDLETLSSIAPGLPKCFQEQLLAKLPPTQARKLSRTLSMQNDPQTSKVKVCKRSQSGGRNTIPSGSTNIVERCAALPEECESSPSKAMTHKNAESFNDQNARNPSSSSQLLNRRSITRMRNEYESGIPTPMSLETSTIGNSSARKSRSNSVCRDDYSKSLCSPYTSEISDKYKYYSPYLSKSARDPATTTTTTSSTESGSVSPYKQRYSSVSPRESTIGSVVGRPPSGCLSPPLATGGDVSNSSSLRRRTTQRRISRFLRPDFYEELPITSDDTPYQREKKLRERETQNVLREIRQKSRESSRERVLDHNDGNAAHVMRKHSVAGTEAELLPTTKTDYHRHVRNKSVELFNDLDSKAVHATSVSPTKRNRRSLSRSRNTNEELDTHALADKILQELQLLSAMRSEQENEKLPVPREVSLERTTETTTVGVTDKDETVSEQKTVTLKKVKKLKPKDKIVDSAVEPTDNKLTTTTVVKKVKKIVKKADNTKTPTSELPMAVDAQSVEKNNGGEIRKESKLKRPKSYPTKEQESRSEILSKVQAQPVIPEVVCDAATCPQMQQCAANTVDTMPRESRLMRPKSYPVSKIAPPKEVKKVVTRSGAAISSISESNSSAAETTSKSATLSRQSTSEEKSQSQSATPTGKSSVDTSSSSESRPTIKKVIKVTKKSKLMQPTPITPTTPPTTTIATPANETTKEWKEKSPEKKPNKGLLYAIGQKFEKFRDSAMNKEKRAQLNANSNSSSAISVATAKENNTSEKVEKKTSLLKKKKSLDGAMTPTLKTEKTAKTIVSEENKTNKKPNGNAGEMGKTQLKTEKRSRLDAMIRSIRERSVPRAQPVNADSNYIKRALSVEEIPSTQSNKNAMNRVLGLFKRSEKEGSTDRRVRSTRSTSNLERQLSDNAEVASPIYQNTKEAREAAKVEHALANERYECDSLCANNIAQEMLTCPDCIAQNKVVDAVIKRREARANMTPKSKAESTPAPVNKTSDITPQGNKDKRRGLMLDLVKIDNVSSYPNNSSNASTTTTATRNSKACYINGNAGSSISNGIYSNLPPYPYTMPPHSLSNPSSSQHSMDNNTNNNSCMTNNNNNNNNSSSMQTSQTSGYRTSSTHEINRNNLLTPSNENIENYSSDCSRSIQDDCASTSTFLSPTDEPELYFDNWSICSEDNYMVHATPSPTVSRLSRTSQLSSPTRGSAHGGGGGGGGDSSDPNESVIDRIKRRSFYTRFNEKKPKRTSSIVGPTAVRDYYREQKAAIRSARAANKPSTTNNTERNKSPDITQEFLRPLKLSPVGTELKPPVYKSPYSDYTHTPPSTMLKPRKSLNDIRTSASPSYLASKHRYATNTDQKNDYLSVPSSTSAASRYKSSSSSSPYDAGSSNIGGTGSSYYSTYNPKRRSSYTLNGLLPNGTSSATSNIDSYATLGRRTIRPYDQRTLSLLDPTTTNSTSFRRETRTPVRDYATSNISRSNSRYRVSSTPRSPTNI